MNGKSKKVQETEEFVDKYIRKYGYPPTYDEVGEEFGLVRSHAYQRCAKFRNKMNGGKKPIHNGPTRVKLEFDVPFDKFEQFAELLSQMKKLLYPSNT